MDTEYEKSRLEQMKRGLYRPDEELGKKSDDLSPSKIDVGNDWSDNEIITGRKEQPRKLSFDTVLKVLVSLAIAAILASGGYLLYQYFDPLRMVTDKNIIITFDTPVGASPGVPVDVVVRVENRNRVGLEYANLTILYPEGSFDGIEKTKDAREQKKVLGTIHPNETIEFGGKVVLLGEENELKDIQAILEYRFEGVNSILKKEAMRSIRMLSAPVNLIVNTLKEVNAGQKLELSLNIASNTVIPLHDVLVKVEYPLGFVFSKAEPKPTFGNNVWRLESINPSEKFPITIYGVLEGADTQTRVFQTSVGSDGGKSDNEVTTLYGQVISQIIVQRPFIGIQLAINGKPAGDALATYGQKIAGVVKWKNNLPTKIINAQIEVHLFGAALDRKSIKGETGGFYRSIDDTIYWDERGNEALSVLEAGEFGEVGFSFSPVPAVTGTQVSVNPEITAEVTVRGKRLSEDASAVPEEIKIVMTQTVRVTSAAQFVARSLYFVGPLLNSGPIPPKVERETTYTITWSIVNTSNNITNAQVRGILPAYVDWYGAVFPANQNITYSPAINEVRWKAGDIPSGTGITSPPREISFQVVILPSLSQIRLAPALVTDMQFSALDTFTNTEIVQEINSVTTDIKSDPKAAVDAGMVVE